MRCGLLVQTSQARKKLRSVVAQLMKDARSAQAAGETFS